MVPGILARGGVDFLIERQILRQFLHLQRDFHIFVINQFRKQAEVNVVRAAGKTLLLRGKGGCSPLDKRLIQVGSIQTVLLQQFRERVNHGLPVFQRKHIPRVIYGAGIHNVRLQILLVQFQVTVVQLGKVIKDPAAHGQFYVRKQHFDPLIGVTFWLAQNQHIPRGQQVNVWSLPVLDGFSNGIQIFGSSIVFCRKVIDSQCDLGILLAEEVRNILKRVRLTVCGRPFGYDP